MEMEAQEIADIHKRRWQVELFFKMKRRFRRFHFRHFKWGDACIRKGMMYYPWDEIFVYEVYTMPYRTTDIRLEPGDRCWRCPSCPKKRYGK
jgi:hypothetical protein